MSSTNELASLDVGLSCPVYCWCNSPISRWTFLILSF